MNAALQLWILISMLEMGAERKDAILLHCGMCLTGHFTCIFSLNLQQFCEVGSLSDFPNKEPGAQSARWLTKTHAHSKGLRPGGNPQSLSIKPLFPLCCLFRGCDYLDFVKGTERELLGTRENSPSCPVPSWGAEVEVQVKARGGPGKQFTKPLVCSAFSWGSIEQSDHRKQFLFMPTAGNFWGDIL